MLNFTACTGRLTGDPELRHTQSGVPVASFSIAVGRDFVAKGEKDDTDFFDIVAWRATAEFICKHFTKGKMISVVGRLKNRKWQDKEGNNRTTTELQVDRAYFAESKPSDSKQANDDIDPFGGESEEDASDFDDSPAESEETYSQGEKSPWD